jgi:hypothetical protein
MARLSRPLRQAVFRDQIPESVPNGIMPRDAGLILADAYGAEIVREAPEHRMAPATRRAMLIRFAHAAAHRLHRLSDPEMAAKGG